MTPPDRDLMTAYVLGELDATGAVEFEARVSADPQLAAEVESLRKAVAELEGAPPEIWHAQRTVPELRLPGEAAQAPAPGRRRRRLSVGRLGLAGAAAVAVLGVGIAIGLGVGGEDEPAEPLVTSIELHGLSGQQRAAGLVSVASGAPRTAEVVVDGLPPSAADEHYELWLLGDGDPVPIGSFTVGSDGHADSVVKIPVDPGAFESFDISVESDDGDPGHSGDSVLRGPATPS